jgi:hypothetical protein
MLWKSYESIFFFNFYRPSEMRYISCVAYTSQFRQFAMLLERAVGNYEFGAGVTFIPNFMKIVHLIRIINWRSMGTA